MEFLTPMTKILKAAHIRVRPCTELLLNFDLFFSKFIFYPGYKGIYDFGKRQKKITKL